MKKQWHEVLVSSAQAFHGLGKGLGTGRGPRLADLTVPETEKTDEKVRQDNAFASV